MKLFLLHLILAIFSHALAENPCRYRARSAELYEEYITVECTRVPHLKADTLEGFANATRFRPGEGVETVDEDSFKNTPNLDLVEIRLSKIKTLPVNLIKDLPKMQGFHFPENVHISMPKGEPFLVSDHLPLLNLKGCRLEELFSKTFSKLPELRALSLENNRLSTLPADIFSDTPKLEYLHINSNEFHILSADVFKQLPLQHLKLNSNPWDCDRGCKLFPLMAWAVDRNIADDGNCRYLSEKWPEMVRVKLQYCRQE